MAGQPEHNDKPRGELTVRISAMPGDTNANGDIFGGWLLSQMDIAGGVTAFQRAKGRLVTVALDAMTFHTPVTVGDIVVVKAVTTEATEETGAIIRPISAEAAPRPLPPAGQRQGRRRPLDRDHSPPSAGE